MNTDFDYLTALPGEGREQHWIKSRLETLSVREGIILAAAVQKEPPESTDQAINTLQALDYYNVCYPAGSYEQLGRHYLSHFNVPAEALPHIDFDQLGQQYEDQHPGLFVGNCYVEYPKTAPAPVCQAGGILPGDDAWSVKLKVASPTVPEGVWLRLPDLSGFDCEAGSEVELAKDALHVQSWDECVLLNAFCILPEAGDLMEQYDDVADLLYDGQNLGYVLLERGRGEEGWQKKFAAALEFESCRDLKLLLDISQNMSCYEWVPSEGLKDFAAEHLRSCGVSDQLIQSGCIDLEGYAEDLLENSGYMLTGDESGYMTRNNRPFVREYTQEPEPMEQVMG